MTAPAKPKPKKPRNEAAKRNLDGSMPQRAPKNPRGRRIGEGIKLTAEIEAKILSALRVGSPLNTAAAYAAVAPSTFNLWLRQGRDGRQPFKRLVDEIDLAIADGKMRHLVRIDQGADKDWRAAAWLLERRFPTEFGEKTQSEITVQARPFIDVSKLTITEQQTLLALLEKGSPDVDDVPKDGAPALALLPAASAAA